MTRRVDPNYGGFTLADGHVVPPMIRVGAGVYVQGAGMGDVFRSTQGGGPIVYHVLMREDHTVLITQAESLVVCDDYIEEYPFL